MFLIPYISIKNFFKKIHINFYSAKNYDFTPKK